MRHSVRPWVAEDTNERAGAVQPEAERLRLVLERRPFVGREHRPDKRQGEEKAEGSAHRHPASPDIGEQIDYLQRQHRRQDGGHRRKEDAVRTELRSLVVVQRDLCLERIVVEHHDADHRREEQVGDHHRNETRCLG